MLQKEVMETCADWVKRSTRTQHENAESVMMPLIRQADTTEKYGRLLQWMYGYYHPLERALQDAIKNLPLPDPAFERSHLIQYDLNVLGLPIPHQHCTFIPAINNAFQALGALYVLEGAALGGRIIARLLSASGNLPQTSFQFFKGRAEGTGPHWTTFIRFLNTYAHTPAQVQEVTAKATAVFDTHTRWMQNL